MINAGISVTPPAANATISYGLTNKIALQAYGNIDGDDGAYLQSALGYYKVLSNQRIMELYGGFGYGSCNYITTKDAGSLSGNYQQYFLQFNYGKLAVNGRNFDYGFGLKTAYFSSDFEDQNYFDYYSEFGPFNTIKNNSILLEPAAFIRFGGKHLKVNVKLATGWMYQFTNRNDILPCWPVNLGIGLNYRF